MSGPTYRVDIDRLVLSGLDLTPAQAERFRAQVAGELQRLLERGAALHGLAGGELPRASAPAIDVAETGSRYLARSLAQSIAWALQGAGRVRGGA